LLEKGKGRRSMDRDLEGKEKLKANLIKEKAKEGKHSRRMKALKQCALIDPSGKVEGGGGLKGEKNIRKKN